MNHFHTQALKKEDFDHLQSLSGHAWGYHAYTDNKSIKAHAVKMDAHICRALSNYSLAVYDNDKLIGVILANVSTFSKSLQRFKHYFYVFLHGLYLKCRSRASRNILKDLRQTEKAYRELLKETKLPYKDELVLFVTHPDYQGQGIADSLILFGIGKTKEQGFESLKIDTHAANGPMRKLLKKHQFEPRGYIKAIDRLAYERRIDYRFAHRILIFGNAGTGKTTLARMLGEKLQLDVIHLDTIYWLKNWQSLSKPDFNKAVLSYLKQHPRFVMDGNYTNHTNFEDRLKISDTVILLNYHEKTALKGVIERENVYKHRYRSDMATGCIEELDQEFLQYVAFFEPKRHKLEAIINSLRPKKNILVFDTREALMHWYNSL